MTTEIYVTDENSKSPVLSDNKLKFKVVKTTDPILRFILHNPDIHEHAFEDIKNIMGYEDVGFALRFGQCPELGVPLDPTSVPNPDETIIQLVCTFDYINGGAVFSVGFDVSDLELLYPKQKYIKTLHEIVGKVTIEKC